MKIRLEKGELTQCPEGNLDLIYGIPYEKVFLSDREEDMVRYIYSVFLQYRLARRPLDLILNPQDLLEIPELENTYLHPEIAVMRNGDSFPSWIAEFVDEETFDVGMMLKPMIYRDAGVLEYWAIDSGKATLYVFDLTKKCLMPKCIGIPQRISVGIYKDLLIPYSGLFKKR